MGELVRGRVAAVQLSGQSWCTKLQLTARQLVVSAPDSAALDYGELLRGRVALTAPARGWAEAVFDAEDFGNFLVYPQVAAALPSVAGQKLRLPRQGTSILMSGEYKGRAHFTVHHAKRQFNASLEARSDGTGAPRVRLLDVTVPEGAGGSADHSSAIEKALEVFFEGLCIDLAGVEVRFAALAFGHHRGKEVLLLRLSANIVRIPNPLRDRI